MLIVDGMAADVAATVGGQGRASLGGEVVARQADLDHAPLTVAGGRRGDVGGAAAGERPAEFEAPLLGQPGQQPWQPGGPGGALLT